MRFGTKILSSKCLNFYSRRRFQVSAQNAYFTSAYSSKISTPGLFSVYGVEGLVDEEPERG